MIKYYRVPHYTQSDRHRASSSQWREVSKSQIRESSPRDSSGSRHVSPRRSHSHQKTFLASSPTRTAPNQDIRGSGTLDSPRSVRTRRPELERVAPREDTNSYVPTRVHNSQSWDLQDVEIHTDMNLIYGNIPDSAQQAILSPTGQRPNLLDRLSHPHNSRNSPIEASPHSQDRIPISLRLGDRLEEQREVTLTRTESKKKASRGGGTTRGKGRGRGKGKGRGGKTVPSSPLIGVGSIKMNAIRAHSQTQAPSKRKLCLDKQTNTTRLNPSEDNDPHSANLPLNEDTQPSLDRTTPRTGQASISRTQVDFRAPPCSLP